MKIGISNPLFLITKLSSKTRIFATVSIMACYGLFLYELLPEYLFSFPTTIYYFIIPVVVIAAIFVGIPKFTAKKMPNRSDQNLDQGIEQTASPTESVSFEAPKQESGMIMTNNTPSGMSDMIMPSPASPGETMVAPAMTNPVVDENVLNDMVTRAVDPFQRELVRMQDTVSDVRAEINSIRSTIQDLTLTFETSLTDLKAFQTEIANPLNFMRKYFDSIDIKGLSDPTLPLHAEQSPIHIVNSAENSMPNSQDQQTESSQTVTTNNNLPTTTTKQIEEIQPKQELHESIPFTQLFNGSLTLGKLMTTTTILEEILQTVDRNSIDILIEQCKLMGLRQEDERVIYNIISLMDQSGLSVKEILVMLYKFGKVMGIADTEADLTYAKLMMNQGKSQGSLVTVESKVK
ncbi:hypothetical protein [Candidatus Nitrosotalea okcheonensis]|uniref:Uncharacterized protein n=1 Tax=Candidatus Nitrosotalea okcheonensis TaxID=1903276 RepID=A0A2H1FDL2_9ARCH|nr:hypothetical protein [Candidatus Nitrosotalea okcheonensis]SMH70850.1 conserved protein of unknown function [Candidatus Nitrosotalea okcheonensis]